MKRAAFLLGVAALVAALAARRTRSLPRSTAALLSHVDKKLVGPPTRRSRKYRGDKAAEARLIDKVKKGGQGCGAGSDAAQLQRS